MTTRTRSAYLESAFLAAVIMVVAACSTGDAAPAARPPTPPVPADSRGAVLERSTGGASIADVAERVVPSVVNLSATRIRKTRGVAREGLPPMLREFFGPELGPMPPGERREGSLGSGVIVSADGLVLTSAHVVDGADAVEITLHDGRELDGEVVGADRQSDVAVVRIAKKDATDLTPLPMGDSAALRLGEVVLAVGNPFGVGQTVTMGIVSATGRSALGIVDYEDFIQTDAAINPGNSGGALVNMRGQLVGINTAILSRSGGNQGVGFAIPTAMARPIMASLVKSGHVTRGYLGVVIQDIDRDLAQAMKLQANSGALVADVEDDSPAAKAGIQRGDVIRAVDGKKVESTSQLRNRVAALAPGAVVRVELVRDGAPQTVEVKLQARAADQEQPGQGSGGPRSGQPDRSTETEDGLLGGATLHELTPALRRQLDVPSDVTAGVVVERVAPGSGADKLGLQRGDVLVEIDRRKVSSPAEVRAASKQLGDAVAVRVVRQGRSLYLASRK